MVDLFGNCGRIPSRVTSLSSNTINVTTSTRAGFSFDVDGLPLGSSWRTFVLPFNNYVCHLQMIWMLMHSCPYTGTKWWWILDADSFFAAKNWITLHTLQLDTLVNGTSLILNFVSLRCYVTGEVLALLPLYTNNSCPTFVSLLTQFSSEIKNRKTYFCDDPCN